MDKDTIFLMLDNIKKSGLIGPKKGNYAIGARVDFALQKELIKRLETGGFAITEKGNNLLENKTSWDSL
jgi:predicted transcriptional regulator